MKKAYLSAVVIVALILFGGVISSPAADDIGLHKNCIHCGMDRGMFNFSRMLIEYDDGTVAPVCSLHCASINLAISIDKTPKAIKVADFKEKELIDAENSFWVIGGAKPGVMSKQGKWAFGKKEDAEAFMKTNQGKLVSFEEAMKASYDDMYVDTNMIREKRKMKRAQMGDAKMHGSH